MGWEEEYQRKLMTLDEALDTFIPDGTSVFMGTFEVARGIINPMLDRIKEGRLKDIDLYGGITSGPLNLDFQPEPGALRYHTHFTGGNERTGMTNHSVSYAPIHLHRTMNLAADRDIDVAVIPMTPPDKHGYCNIGHVGDRPDGIKNAKKILAQINPSTPWVCGLERNLHVSQIDGFVEIDQPMFEAPIAQPTPEEITVGNIICELIPDGSCIQLGFGSIANAIAEGLKARKHLGVHSEMFNDAMAKLQEMGVIDNSRKNYLPGVSVAGFASGQQYLYDFIDHNPGMLFTPYSHVNNPDFIRKNDNFVSVNSAVSVDLTGQVCAESIGTRQYSGTGGQVDFIRGATASKNGKAIIAITSIANTKKGPVSKIAPILAPGSVVTTARTDIQYVVTEYGCVNLQHKDMYERAKLLISIAHPDHRDMLTFEAKKNGFIW
ncbi:MAG: acetyl-CoA hydrolase/transferase family protein [Anaerotardibacter sp.]